MDASGEFHVWESLLVNRLGQSRAHLKSLREEHLIEGTDFVKKDRRIIYTAAAMEKLQAALSLTHKELPPLNGVEITHDEKKQPHAAVLAPEVFKFKFYPKKVLHPRMVLVTDGRNIFRVVGVRKKDFFIMGMEVACTHVQHDLYEYHGNPPRSRGRY